MREEPKVIESLGVVAASRASRMKAAGLIAALTLATLVIAPMGQQRVVIMRGFLPALLALGLLGDWLTGYLLWGQAQAGRDRGLAVLAATYFATGILVAVNAWVFPAAFLSGSGRPGNLAGWVWIFWHVAFTGGLLIYARTPGGRARDEAEFLWSARLVFLGALVVVAVALALAFSHALPRLIGINRRYYMPVRFVVLLIAFLLAALGVFVAQRRWRTVLDTWLSVALATVALNAVLIGSAHGRYRMGWYAGPLVSVVGGLSVVVACVFEVNQLYRRLIENSASMADAHAGLLAANSELTVMAEHDSLTQLLNRRALDAHLAEGFAAYRQTAVPFSLLMVDLDYFKAINDHLGHLGGDAILTQVARRLTQAVRGSDVIGRYGGEEFAVYLPGTGLPGARAVGLKLLSAVRAEPFVYGGRVVPVTMSIGVATVSDSDTALEDLVQRADRALYRAKRRGRDRQVVSGDAPGL